MKKIIVISSIIALGLPVSAIAKVCFACKDAKPVKYVCAEKDTFTARKNARKLGCKITSYSSICECGVTVKDKISTDIKFEKRYFGWL
jgi:hypothetical protein